MHFNRYVSTTSGIGYLWEVYRAEGLVAVFLRLLHALQLRISYVAYSLFPRKKFFMYKGSALNYISNSYNQSSWNERSIEIPLMHYYLEPYLQKKSVNILEIGAVLQHYELLKPHWIVLDKFEKHPGVINEDIEFFKPKKKFQFIFSISTFEHIGKDDDRNDPEKLSRCISNIIDHCLAPAGRLVATAPLGYNHQLDSLIFQNMLGCSACYFLQRTSWSNEWKQIELTDITAAGYCWPYNNASVIAVMEWGNFSRTQR